jgi:hypothetical protein
LKALIFAPQKYSISSLLKIGFEKNGWNAEIVDIDSIIPAFYSFVYNKTIGLPKFITGTFHEFYYKKINSAYLKIVSSQKPESIVIYNNQFFFPETIKQIKQNSKVIFYLGDNPLWSNTFDYNLQILQYSDYTISPDSHWTNELTSIGIPNIYNDYIGYSEKVFFKTKKIPNNIHKKYKSDLIFIGSNYSDASGYKRTLFMSKFKDFNFKIFGNNSWNRWLKFFPELHKNFNYLETRISNTELNYAINSAKIYIIDQNTGIINGIHNRVFEVIGAGCLPVVEWRKDLDTYFNFNLPTIKNYDYAEKVVSKYLNNETLRKKTINTLRITMEENFNPELFVKRLINKVKI